MALQSSLPPPWRPSAVVPSAIAKRLPGNPFFYPDTTNTAPPTTRSSAASTFTRSQSTLSHKIAFHDQRCLFTGAVTTELRACHLINTIRTKNNTKKSTKALIEFILTRQGFNGGSSFYLDSMPNCIGMESQWHGVWEKHGGFCITLPPQQLLDLAKLLERTNLDWEARARADPNAQRKSRMLEPEFQFIDYTILVLRPEVLLPHNQPIFINPGGSIRKPGEPVPPLSAQSEWLAHETDRTNDTPHLVNCNTKKYLPDIRIKSTRREGDSISVFCLIVNANSKLQHAANIQSLGHELLFYTDIHARLIDLIFFLLPRSKLRLVFPKSRVVHPARSGKPHHGFSEDVSSSTRNSSSSDEEEEESDDPKDEDGDTVNGLTPDEFDALVAKANDGHLAPQDRADAYMMLLGMARKINTHVLRRAWLILS
ncbi:hypothetical protein C8R46DRAFT_1123494 [Mycena filopes]|nr:hypothetical protein C8R46DRAFT_1123494 [Mycena filopes]